MKRKLTIVLATIIFTLQSDAIMAFATEKKLVQEIEREELKNDNNDFIKEKDKINSKEENLEKNSLLNSKYTLEKKDITKKYITNDIDMKIEMKDDFEALNNLKYLVPKTNFKYEIVEAHSDGSYSYLDNSKSLEEAMSKADNLKNSKKINGNSLTAVINENGQIVYSQLAIGKIIKHVNGQPYPNRDKNTDIYSDENLKNAYTYINHGYVDDAAIIEDKGSVAKILVSGYKGWINKNTEASEFDMIVVPVNQVTNPSFYKNVNGNLVHFISSDITAKKGSGHSISIGKAPSFMKENQEYYSYDGMYFYNNLVDLINDSKSDSTKNAVNNGNEFYSYYLNLPFRSKSVFTANEINNFIDKNTAANSKLRGIGNGLINAQEIYGVNALMILSVAINESNWGQSSIAQQKNNIFGINAVDSNPGQAANSFATVEDCINEFAKNYISRGYSDLADWRYRGSHLGNKNLGANVKYASDPYWGEKATKYMYQVDLDISKGNLKEYNAYALGFHNKASQIKDKNGDLFYDIKVGYPSKAGFLGTAVIVDSYENQKNLYKVNAHRNSNIATGKFQGEYDWNNLGYIKADDLKVINSGKINQSVNLKYSTYIEGLGWQEQKTNGELSGTIGKAKAIEVIKINLESSYGIKLKYRVHSEDIGWQPWRNSGEAAGVIGKQIEAIEIDIDGNNEGHDLEYRTHVEDIGWQPWKKTGETAGTIGQVKQIEAIEIRAKKQNIVEAIQYETHVEDYGWQGIRKDGMRSGTSGEGKRLEGIKIKLYNKEIGNLIKYRAHVEDYGWQEWTNNGQLAGTVGEKKRLEAIEIKIDNLPSKYKLEYRVHIEDYGWQSWKGNGEIAGTSGEAKQIEAIEIRIIEK